MIGEGEGRKGEGSCYGASGMLRVHTRLAALGVQHLSFHHPSTPCTPPLWPTPNVTVNGSTYNLLVDEASAEIACASQAQASPPPPAAAAPDARKGEEAQEGSVTGA